MQDLGEGRHEARAAHGLEHLILSAVVLQGQQHLYRGVGGASTQESRVYNLGLWVYDSRM